MSSSIGIVIPVVDEAARIGAQLAYVTRLEGVTEVVVVDGGSHDATRAIVREVSVRDPRVRLIDAPRGRSAQLAAGVRIVRADVVLLLDAGVRLPLEAPATMWRAFQDPKVVAGAFRLKTIPEGPWCWRNVLLPLADWRSRYARYPEGRQGVFVRRSVLERIGGVPMQAAEADVALAERLSQEGRIVTVPAQVRVAVRRAAH